MTDDAQVAAAMVTAANAHHGLRYRLDGRFAAGSQGAWKLLDPVGRAAVLKYSPSDNRFLRPAVAQAVGRLRQRGYPTPAWIAVGEAGDRRYAVQDYVDGEPATLTPRVAELCVEIIELQAGLAPKELDRDWSSYVYDEAWAQGSGAREYLCALGAPGRELVAHFDQVLRDHGPVPLPTDDLVHGDFQSSNVLVRDDRIVGVVDIEALGGGTRVIDYAWLLREAFARRCDSTVITSLRAAAESVAGPAVLATCAAATALDIVRFVDMRRPEDTPPLIGAMHDLADYLTAHHSCTIGNDLYRSPNNHGSTAASTENRTTGPTPTVFRVSPGGLPFGADAG